MSDTPDAPRFVYVRDLDRRPLAVVALLSDAYGVAVCHPRDVFRKDVGCRIGEARARWARATEARDRAVNAGENRQSAPNFALIDAEYPAPENLLRIDSDVSGRLTVYLGRLCGASAGRDLMSADVEACLREETGLPAEAISEAMIWIASARGVSWERRLQ